MSYIREIDVMPAVNLCKRVLTSDHAMDKGDQSIRLVNGPSRCAGRVEVFHNEEWGTVCDDSWDIHDVKIVCNQLGCGTALSAPANAQYGRGNGTIWLDDVMCKGTEPSIDACPHSAWGTHDCHHGEDASAVCSEHLPKPVLDILTANHSSELQFICTVSRLFVSSTVYFKELTTNRTLGNVSLPYSANVAQINASQIEVASQYTCQYEVKAKNLSFMSPSSAPVSGYMDFSSFTTVYSTGNDKGENKTLFTQNSTPETHGENKTLFTQNSTPETHVETLTAATVAPENRDNEYTSDEEIRQRTSNKQNDPPKELTDITNLPDEEGNTETESDSYERVMPSDEPLYLTIDD
ncbi:deleted in malignant brain tumors 1 protein [Bombina bombina]|uniref:deleted in malignant brain tumors 1 protein n=1 Tax=Bombina bombina TaxID=8345 RepID=UPI00235A5065|nr:deleted in malignant brain tumors 1 protein [Bombina bombina]